MRIDEKRPDIETYGGGVEESFSVGNLGRIFKILRNSMYAHPIKAICREVASNARDAHREVGTPEKPIEIHLPNAWDNHFKIKDFGPGISPDRMSNIFLKYGNSTKNSDDVQTGGFGLGAKTPFAYSDQFQITTISEDNGIRTKRIYVAYIDESEEGKMRLVSEVETEEHTGTEVSINVAENDFGKFTEATTEVCRYWDPKPELTGRVTVEWPEETRELFLEGEGWQMFKQENGYYGYNEKRSLAIVDGIQYPINTGNIDGLTDDNGEKLLNRGMKFFFETGDVRLSANREELQYDEKTCPIILSRLNDCLKQVSTLIEDGVTKATSYSEAVVKYNEFKNYLSFAIRKDWAPEWNGTKVPFNMTVTYAPGKDKSPDGRTNYGWVYYIDEFALRSSRRTYSKVLRKEKVNDMRFRPDGKMTVILNDMTDERVSRSRVQYYMDEHDLDLVYVITSSNSNIDDALNRMKEDNHHDISPRLFDTVLMSSINVPRKKAGGRRRGQGSNRSAYSAFEHDRKYTANRSCDNHWRPVEVDMDNDGGVYVTISGRCNDRFMNKNEISDDEVSAILSFVDDSDLKIHGIRERDLKKLGSDWTPLHVFLEEKIEEALEDLNLTEQDIADRIASKEFAYNLSKRNQYNSDFLIGETYNKGKELLSDDSALKRYIEKSEKAQQEYSEVIKLWSLLRIRGKLSALPTGKPDSSLKALAKECQDSYPLLSALRYSNVNIKNVVQYVLLIDKEKAEEAALGLDNAADDDQDKAANG